MSERRSRVTPFVGAGAAGLALAFAAAPSAMAQQAPQSTSAPADPGGADPAAVSPRADATTTSSSPVTPDYGYQKFRVGVQIKAGAVVPDGTTTAGSQVTITETGPSVDGTLTTTCNTTADSQEAGSSATYCTFDHVTQNPPPVLAEARAGARIDGTPFNDFYIASPGDTVTLQQTTVEPNLLFDPDAQTVGPAVTDAGCFYCASAPTRDPVLFNDPAPGPVAAGECISLKVGASQLVDVLANDTPKAPVTRLAVVVPPEHGTAEVVGRKIRYTSTAGAGPDSFTYEVTTGNGTARARVCVTVLADAPSTTDAPSSSASVSASTTSKPPTTAPPAPTSTTVPPLANTGTDSSSLALVGGGLVVIGAAATVAGSRRRRGRHA